MSHRDMKEELTCPICMELFRQPRRLPCGHSYCHVCLRSVLDRNTGDSGLYVNYSRSIICPECRDEVVVDNGRGIEAIPPDFKLSKLVDLFKFMKRSDSSDSSGDEQQSVKPTTGSVTSLPSGILSQHIDSYPAQTSQQHTPVSGYQVSTASVADQSVVVTPVVDQSATATPIESHLLTSTPVTGHSNTSSPGASLPTQLQQSSPPVSDDGTGTSASLTSPQVQSNRIHSASELSTNSSPVSSSSTSAEYSINQLSTRSVNVSDSSVPHSTLCHINSGSNVTTAPPSNLVSDAENLTYGQTNSEPQTSSIENQCQLQVNGSTCQEHSPEQSIDVQLSRSVHNDRNDSDELNSYSELGAVGGIVASGSGERRLPSCKEHQVDTSEILSDWVNENHCYSQSCRNISHSSVSLPAEVGSEEVNGFSEHLPELNTQFHDADRVARAQSVPTETEEWQRSVKDGVPVENIATKGRNVKARKVKRGIFSRFVDSDTNSDSSESDREEEGRSAGKPKRWLMTRFLRSVILSDSSSTDYSDDDDEAIENKGNVKRKKETTHPSQKQSLTVSSSRPQSHTAGPSQEKYSHTGVLAAASTRKPAQTAGPENLLNTQVHSDLGPEITSQSKPSSHISVKPQATSAQQNISTSSWRRETSNQICGAVLQSVDSNTSPKELARETGQSSRGSATSGQVYSCELPTEGHIDALPNSGISSLSPNLHTSDCSSPRVCQDTKPTASISSSRARQHEKADRNEMEQRTSNLPSIGSPPTFYDNLNTMHSGSGEVTRYDNVLVRDERFNPCNEEDTATALTSGCTQGRTLYDNVDNHCISLPQASPSRNHTHIRMRNPVTDIEDLKTGYEHVVADGDISGAGVVGMSSSVKVNDRLDNVNHMAELDHTTRCVSLSSQESQDRSDLHVEAGPNFKSSKLNLAQSQCLPADHATNSGDHPSLYDNISNPVSVHHSQSSSTSVPPMSTREIPVERRDFSESNISCRMDCLAERDRNTQIDSTTGQLHMPGRSDDSLHYMDNYFDHYSGHFRRENISAQNFVQPSEATGEENMSERRTDVGGIVESSATLSSAAGGRVAAVEASSANSSAEVAGRTADGGDESVDDDDVCHSGTSMLQNKRKPRSRLKKFLTSLLSLSSSSDEEDNYRTKSSSESSDW